jgi:hypothetical protein
MSNGSLFAFTGESDSGNDEWVYAGDHVNLPAESIRKRRASFIAR